jgi:hypothetical protein
MQQDYYTGLIAVWRVRTRYNAAVRNPWSELRAQSPYVLDIDQASIYKYNAIHNNDERVIVESIPEPFIGNPQSAKVVLLSLNPGHSDDDAKAHSDAAFRGAMSHNLRHEAQEFPFYALNPKFSWTACGNWWKAHTSTLQKAGLSWEAISEGLLVIEWFPYHSRRSGLPIKPVCPSQEYSFQLAREVLESKIVVGMRSKKFWLNAVPTVHNVSFLKNPQNPHISPANAGAELFDRIVEALR